MSKKYKPKGLIKEGYGFLFCRRSRSITVVNMKTFQQVNFVAPRTMINRFDLHLWAHGYLAGKDRGWGSVI